MNAKELIGAGKLQEALGALQAEVRRDPADPKLRIFLFQLECLLGRLEKALNQLETIESLSPNDSTLGQIFRPVIAGELARREVFAGTRPPLIFRESAEWLVVLTQACAASARGDFGQAVELRLQAFDLAPAARGKINGDAFAWLADADSRLGPVFEMILSGKYYWVPFAHVAKVEIEKPTDLRDLAWIPVRFTWTDGGAVSAHIPVRYPGYELLSDDAVRMARATTWREAAPEYSLGAGQRILATDANDYPLLECRNIEFEAAAGV